MSSPGTLYLVATPIGNLEDITLRALRILKEADVILCEDTSVSRKLLDHYGIRKRLVSYYRPKERAKLPLVLGLLEEGRAVALITDAGTPLISDPGQALVAAVRERGYAVHSIPGPSSVVTALSLAGFGGDRFAFEGFLPKRDGDRRRRLAELGDLPLTIVCFVPARDLARTLASVRETMGNRKVCIARELTKLYEETVTGRIDDLLPLRIEPRGEITLVIEGADGAPGFDEAAVRGALREHRESGGTLKDLLAAGGIPGVRKNMLYTLWEEIKHGKHGTEG